MVECYCWVELVRRRLSSAVIVIILLLSLAASVYLMFKP